jgi:hypothetical protein
VSPLKIGLDQVPRQQQSEDDKADEIEVDEEQYERIAGARKKRIRFFTARDDSLRIVNGEGQTWEQENEDDPDRAEMPPPRFRLSRARRRAPLPSDYAAGNRRVTRWAVRPIGRGSASLVELGHGVIHVGYGAGSLRVL